MDHSTFIHRILAAIEHTHNIKYDDLMHTLITHNIVTGPVANDNCSDNEIVLEAVTIEDTTYLWDPISNDVYTFDQNPKLIGKYINNDLMIHMDKS
jgi:hypothetical protein